MENILKNYNVTIFRFVKVFLLIFIPIVIALLPEDFFENKGSTCFSVIFLDQECYGCGMTRASMNLINFNFTQAWYTNKLSLIVIPLICFLWIKELLKEIKAIQSNFKND